MKKIVAILLAVLMMLPAFAMAENVVKIGVFEPASGDSGAGGKQEMLGMQYANYVQPTVEIGGETYTVELVYADNGSSADKAPSAAQQLVSEGVSVVLGSYGSGVSIAGSQYFADAGIPSRAPSLPTTPSASWAPRPPTAWLSLATTTTWACATTSSRPLRRWAAR